jgi:hypothetical protein
MAVFVEGGPSGVSEPPLKPEWLFLSPELEGINKLTGLVWARENMEGLGCVVPKIYTLDEAKRQVKMGCGVIRRGYYRDTVVDNLLIDTARTVVVQGPSDLSCSYEPNYPETCLRAYAATLGISGGDYREDVFFQEYMTGLLVVTGDDGEDVAIQYYSPGEDHFGYGYGLNGIPNRRFGLPSNSDNQFDPGGFLALHRELAQRLNGVLPKPLSWQMEFVKGFGKDEKYLVQIRAVGARDGQGVWVIKDWGDVPETILTLTMKPCWLENILMDDPPTDPFVYYLPRCSSGKFFLDVSYRIPKSCRAIVLDDGAVSSYLTHGYWRLIGKARARNIPVYVGMEKSEYFAKEEYL